jgi:hypothetical protein
MPLDLADNTAATTAGYKRVQLDRGAGKSPRYISRYEKPIAGEPGSSGQLWVHEAGSDVSQADVDAIVLNALNAARRHRYGGSPGRASEASTNSPGSRGGAMTTDLH